MMMEAHSPSVVTCGPDGHLHQHGYEAVSPKQKAERMLITQRIIAQKRIPSNLIRNSNVTTSYAKDQYFINV